MALGVKHPINKAKLHRVVNKVGLPLRVLLNALGLLLATTADVTDVVDVIDICSDWFGIFMGIIRGKNIGSNTQQPHLGSAFCGSQKHFHCVCKIAGPFTFCFLEW